MANQLFPIGKEYSVSKFGELYFRGEKMDNEGSHGYGVYLNFFSFEEIHGNDRVIKNIIIGIKDMWKVNSKSILFQENSENFSNLTWEEYKKQFKDFLKCNEKWEMREVETYFC